MIKSKFYLIRGDGEPIYVGFTNRPIKQRFSEHKADKDFSGYEKVIIEKLDELDYEFTWDEDVLYKNANEVSVREAQLVLEYGTQDSKYQKADGGGQVWNYEKWFVKTNKDNPKFVGMSVSEIEEWIEDERAADQYLSDVVNNMRDLVYVYLSGFVNRMLDPVDIYLMGFVMTMKNPLDAYLGSFVNNMKDPIDAYLGNFVNSMLDPVDAYLCNFVNDMKNPVDVYLGSFVNNMKDPIDVYLSSFVGNMKDPSDTYLQNFVNSVLDPIDVYLGNFVGNMYEPVAQYLINFVGSMRK